MRKSAVASMKHVPEVRIRRLNQMETNDDGEYIVYWMIAQRRVRSNFALQRAVNLCQELDKPLLIFEGLRLKYKWASDRLHRFVLQGMADHCESLKNSGIAYYPYVEPEPGAGNGLLEALAHLSCCVVTDDFPCFFLPTMLKHVARRVPVLLEAIDSNGIYPMYATDRIFTRAHSFRRHLQKELRTHLEQFPQDDPLSGANIPPLKEIPEQILKRWPSASAELLMGDPLSLASLAIDHSVGPAAFDGGETVARSVLKKFLDEGFERYADDRNHPDTDASSGLSPYLHFGHISSHTIFNEIADREGWTPANLAERVNGSRDGWWGMSSHAEGFLDELITWRELGYNMCAHSQDYDRYESLPDWAQETLAEHADDERPALYTLEQFEQSQTHDDIWNAAQRQLVRDGRMHNYLRMLWGKKILEWTPTPQDALAVMIELNNKYAVDGRNPNSYSGIFWVLGRYDRAWGPEREIYGKIRYMTSESTRKKLKMKEYLKRYSKPSRLF